MKKSPDHTHLLNAAQQAASSAAAAAHAAMVALQAVMQDESPDAPRSGGQPFADFVAPTPETPANRRAAATVFLGRVHFHCPACRRPTALPLTRRGKPVSCPHCFTGIRTPDPAKNLPAQNLGRTLAPLLRPSDFKPCQDARRLVPWLIRCLPGPVPTLATAGAAMLFASTAAMTPMTMGWAAQDRIQALQHSRPELAVTARPADGARSLSEEASDLVKKFLAAPTVEAKARWVANAADTAPLMADWYARRPGGGTQAEATVTASTQGFSSTPGDATALSEVTVEAPGAPEITYLVEHHKDGPRIAWPESVGYSSVEWKDLLHQSKGQRPVPLRVLACRDDYWNYSFARERDFCCVRLHDPQTLALLGFGYFPRSQLTAPSVAVLPHASETTLRPVMVSVVPRKDSPSTGQVEIVGPVIPGWRAAEIEDTLVKR